MKLFSSRHRMVGFGYLLISLLAVAVGTLLSLVMRLHLTWPAWSLPLHGPVLPEEYLAIVTMHGTLMLFFVLTVAPLSGFANLILPAQIGTRRMAFPTLNLAAMLTMWVALIVLLSAFFVPGGAPIGGWTAYPPLSESVLAGPGQGLGMDLWLVSIALFCVAGTMGAVVMLTTIVKRRCEGMTWERLPLTVWAWFTASLLGVMAFSVLLAALVLLFCDRHLHSGFFVPGQEWINGVMIAHHGDGSPLLWLHLFWFFGHPEVYIAILPGMGLTSMVIANFARRRVFAYRLMIATTLLIGFLGILVWGHHMFVAGLNPFAGTVFSISSLVIALPSAAKVLSWLVTAWGSRAAESATGAKQRMATPMLFALGFVSFFIAGGLTGPILAQPILDEYLHNTFFVIAHFHLIMSMAAIFGIFCAVYYWYPLLFQRQLSERLGRWHFWLTVLGAYGTFLPMYITGLGGEPRHYAQLNGIAGPGERLLALTMPLQRHITYSAIVLMAAQVLFFWNVQRTARGPWLSEENPWDATTLEWAPGAMNEENGVDDSHDRPKPRVFREPCCYEQDGEGFLPQWAEEIPLWREAE